MNAADNVDLLISALRSRTDLMASAMSEWLQRHQTQTGVLADFLGCDHTRLERLAMVRRPQPGPDQEDDIEIIAASLKLRSDALRSVICAHYATYVRERSA